MQKNRLLVLLFCVPLSLSAANDTPRQICNRFLALLSDLQRPLPKLDATDGERDLGELNSVTQAFAASMKENGPADLNSSAHFQLAEAVAKYLSKKGVDTKLEFVPASANPPIPAFYRIILQPSPEGSRSKHYLARMPQKFRERFRTDLRFGFETTSLLNSLTDKPVLSWGAASYSPRNRMPSLGGISDVVSDRIDSSKGGHEIRHATKALSDSSSPQMILYEAPFRPNAASAPAYSKAMVAEEGSTTYPHTVKVRVAKAMELLKKYRREKNPVVAKQLLAEAREAHHWALWGMKVFCEIFDASDSRYDAFLGGAVQTTKFTPINQDHVPLYHYFDLIAELPGQAPILLKQAQVEKFVRTNSPSAEPFNPKLPEAAQHLKKIVEAERAELNRQLKSLAGMVDELMSQPEFNPER